MTDFIKNLKAEAETIVARGDKNLKKMSSGRSDMFKVNPFLLTVEPGWNSREVDAPGYDAAIRELAQQIADQGVLKPLMVKVSSDGKLVVRDGHRRLAATMIAINELGAEILTVPALPVDRNSNAADELFIQITSNSAEKLTAFEMAKVFKRLIGFGWTEAQIAQKAGVTPQTVANTLVLMAMPVPVQKMIVAKTVSPTLARQVFNATGQDADATVAELTNAAVTAAEAGKETITAKHLADDGAASDVKYVSPKKAAKKAKATVNVATEMKAVFDAATIDNSGERDVVVTFSIAEFEKVKELLAL